MKKIKKGNKGSNNPNSKLTATNVKCIKRYIAKKDKLKLSDKYRKMAEKYNVSCSTIYRIATNDTWTHVQIEK